MLSLIDRLRYVWFYAVMKLTGFLPDLVPVMRLRGWLVGPSFGSRGEDFQICSHVIVLSPHRVRVGRSVYLAYGTWIQGHGGVDIGDEVMLGPYTVLASSNHSEHAGSYRFGPPAAAPIVLKNGSWTGAHTTITAGVTVGEGAACAANSVVTKSVDAHAVVGGIPARPLATGSGPGAR